MSTETEKHNPVHYRICQDCILRKPNNAACLFIVTAKIDLVEMPEVEHYTPDMVLAVQAEHCPIESVNFANGEAWYPLTMTKWEPATALPEADDWEPAK